MINETNFWACTKVAYKQIDVLPGRKPDFISGKGRNKSSYWYEKDGVIRASNHWGKCKDCYC